VIRDAAGWEPLNFELDFIDDHDEKYQVRGETVNFYPMHWMQNNMITCCLSKFDCNGQKAWGAFFESMEQDAIRRLLK
jgi:hypothetical protein